MNNELADGQFDYRLDDEIPFSEEAREVPFATYHTGYRPHLLLSNVLLDAITSDAKRQKHEAVHSHPSGTECVDVCPLKAFMVLRER
jgi:hypothetical protein